MIKTSALPKQNVSETEKVANDFEWYKQNCDYFIELAIREKFNTQNNIAKARRLAAGIVDQKDYDAILRPYKRSNIKFTKGDIKSHPLITQVLKVLAGEKRKAPFNYTVDVINPDVKNKYIEELDKTLLEAAEQFAINEINKVTPTGVPSKEMSSLDTILAKFNTTYSDKRAIAGQELLDILIEDYDLKELMLQVYKDDWIQTGECYVTIDVAKSDVIFNKHKPENTWVYWNNESVYAEDGYAFVIKHTWHIADILKRFDEELATKYVGNNTDKSKGRRKAIDFLNEIYKYIITSNAKTLNMQNENFESVKEYDYAYNSQSWIDGIFTVYRVVWVGERNYQILTYLDEFGIEQQLEVDETYKLNKSKGDISIETITINQLHQAFKVPSQCEDYDLYFETQPLTIQQSTLSNYSSYKLPIVGRKDGVSIPLELENFQYLYDLVYKIEEHTLSKDFGQITPFPVSLLPKTLGWGTDSGQIVENLMYYAYRFPFLFYDDSSPNAAQLAQAIRSVDLSTLDSVIKFINLKESIKADAFSAIGFNDNRLGQAQVSEGKGKNEEQIFRSAVHTADMNISFNKIEERLLNSGLNHSKYAFINGKSRLSKMDKGNYQISDSTIRIFELDVEQHLETEYNVKVKAVDTEVEKLNAMRTLIQPLAQNIGNGVTPSMITKIINTDNPNKIERYLDEAFKIQQEYIAKREQEQQEQQNALAEQQNAILQQQEQFKQQIEQEKLQIERDRLQIEKYKADLDAQVKLQIGTENGNDIAERIEDKKLQFANTKLQTEAALKNKEIEVNKNKPQSNK